MKFHTEENVADAVSAGLRRRGFDVTTSAQSVLLGSTDEKQLEFCRTEVRVMISHDADMLRLAVSGVKHAGIVYCHKQKYREGAIVNKLLILAGKYLAKDMINRIEFL